MNETPLDLLISNGTVLTMDSRAPLIENGAVAVQNDGIVWVGPASNSPWKTAKRHIDARGGIIMPGLINTHTHAAMTLFRGIADDLPLMSWLNDHIFPAEAGLTEEKVYWGALLACAEMILSGTTCFCDMYLFEGGVARAAADAGMRAIVGEVLFDFPSPHYGELEKGFAYSRSLATQWKDHPLVSIAIEPHSPYLCAPDLLQRGHWMAEEMNLRLVVHVSETQSEVEQIRGKYGVTPVRHLANLGVLSSRLLACHCVVLENEDISLLKAHEVKVAHNPESNMKLASGIAPVPQLMNAGICVSLGTDGCASNNNLDMFREMDTAAKLHKVHALDPTVMAAADTLRMATLNGAAALGLDAVTGSLVAGKKADIIVIDTRKPHLTPMYRPESHLVYAASGSDVMHTIINGRVVMENRHLLTMDVNTVMQEVREIVKR
ncbi:MAG: amidohydrolase [Desulfobacterales bacterium]|jgi:5-methylthioadenosine/S-adenosylhomocysteine deaminase|nr:amidohydrolase [Desulfobacterales bacterium]